MCGDLCVKILNKYIFKKYLYQQNIKKKGNKKDSPEKVKLFDKKKSNVNCTTSVKQINKYIQFIPTGELSYKSNINKNKNIYIVSDRQTSLSL